MAKIQELVDKRNNIAHGDLTAEATYQDIASYRKVVWTFSDERIAVWPVPY